VTAAPLPTGSLPGLGGRPAGEGFPWVKGHGTRNDFVLLPDPDGSLHGDLDAATVRLLCDRRGGIGADGVIRVVRSSAVDGVPALDGDPWFMDYRNADGSLAEMCGNGVRVLARYLWESGLADADPLPVATRGGLRLVHRGPDGGSTVEMGVPRTADVPARPVVSAAGRSWLAVAVLVPNPHAVLFVDDLADAGDLREPPVVTPPEVFPDGANVEFVLRPRNRRIALRVHERGVGETPSCGTGVVAAAWVAMRRDDAPPGTRYLVDVPGGTLAVEQRDDGVLLLTGPAVLGPRGWLDLRWLR
jgi:diaminopimelate epimerase